MEKRCINCYSFDELDEDAREEALRALSEDPIMGEIAREHAQAAAESALARYGFKLERGPWYDLYRGEFALQASWVGDAEDEWAKDVELKAAGAYTAGAFIKPVSTWLGGSVNIEAEALDEEGEVLEDLEEDLEDLARKAIEEAKDAVREAWDLVFREDFLADFARENGRLFTENGKPCPI